MQDKAQAILRAQEMRDRLQDETIIKKKNMERWSEILLEKKFEEETVKVKIQTETELMLASYHNELAENYKHSNRSYC